MTQRTPNQVIAHNLRAAREERGWSQDEAASRLEEHLGERWSAVVFSAAERSVTGKRVRQFDADEIEAFARTFDLPLAWFVLPPDENVVVRPPSPAAADPATFVDQLALIFPRDVRPLVDELNRRLVDPDVRRQCLEQLRAHVVGMVGALFDEASNTSDLREMARVVSTQGEVVGAIAGLAFYPQAETEEQDDE